MGIETKILEQIKQLEEEKRLSDKRAKQLFMTIGWINVDNYPSFSAAIDAIGASEKTLVVASEQAVTDDKTVPANITVFFLHGGSLNVSAGKTVTFNGHVEAGLYQIFEGDGDVSFSEGSIKAVYPEWFGAVGDGSTDDGTALNKTADSIRETHIKYMGTATNYRTTIALDFSKLYHIVFTGDISTGVAFTGAVVTLGYGTSSYWWYSNYHFHKITHGGGGTSGNIALKVQNLAHSTIKADWLSGGEIGLYVLGNQQGNFLNTYIINAISANRYAIVIEGTGEGSWSNVNHFYCNSLSSIYATGTPAKPATLITAADGGAGNLSGTYNWYHTYYNPTSELESATSPITASLTVSSKQATLSGFVASTEEGVEKINIYRNKDGEDKYYYVGQKDNDTNNYTDNVADGSLGDEFEFHYGIWIKGAVLEQPNGNIFYSPYIHTLDYAIRLDYGMFNYFYDVYFEACKLLYAKSDAYDNYISALYGIIQDKYTVTDKTSNKSNRAFFKYQGSIWESKARAYASTAAQTITNATAEVVELDAETYDPASRFSTANYRYTAYIGGYYQISAQITYTNVTANKNYWCIIRSPNSSTTKSSSVAHSASTDDITVTVSDIIYVEKGEYIYLYAYHDAGEGNEPDIKEGTNYTFLSLHWLSP